MSDEEVMEMLVALIQMSEENFQASVEYVTNIDASDETKIFFNELIRVALVQRQKQAVACQM